MSIRNFRHVFGITLPLWLIGGFGLNWLNHSHRSNAEIVEMSIFFALIMAVNSIFLIRQGQRRDRTSRDEQNHPH
jgi:hypothetical protein